MIETIGSFCDRHGACEDGKQWAVDNCATMLDVWERAKPELLVWVATRPGVVDDKTLRLFACWCVRQVWHLLEERSRDAALVAEKFANGDAAEDELTAIRHAASDDAWDIAWSSAWSAATGADAWAAQAKWLRENAKPNFEVVLEK